MDEYYETVVDRIHRLADRYEIEIEIDRDGSFNRMDQTYWPRDIHWGPQGDSGVSCAARYVYAYAPDAEILLHEVMHVIIGPVSLNMCEAYLLMPFEAQVAKHIARDLPDHGRHFLKCVKDYQLMTYIGVPVSPLSDHGPHYRSRGWWKHGIRRAQRLGLLDESCEPTFRYPKWIGSGVAAPSVNWDPSVDRNWR